MVCVDRGEIEPPSGFEDSSTWPGGSGVGGALTRGLVSGTWEDGPPPPFDDSGTWPVGNGGGEDHRACALGSLDGGGCDFEEGCCGSLDGLEGGGGGAIGVEDLGEGLDGGCAGFGGLDAGAGVGCAFDEGEFLLDFECFEPLGDGGDGGVEHLGDVGEGEAGGEDGGKEGGFIGVLGERVAGSRPPLVTRAAGRCPPL